MRQDLDLEDDHDDATLRTFHKGAILFREGQPSEVAYIIRKGRVAIYRVVNNKRVVLGERGPGEMVGEMGVMTAAPRSSSAEALEFTEAMVCDSNLIHTMLQRSPRPVQLLTGYLVDHAKTLTAQVTDRPSGNAFLSVCRVTALCWQAAPGTGKAKELSYAELSTTIKDIVLLNQIEIDAVFARLAKLHLVSLTAIKASFARKDPLLGTSRPGTAFVKDKTVRLTDSDTFLSVAKNVARDFSDPSRPMVDLEFCDLAAFAREAGSTPDIIYKKLAYQEIPQDLFFFHKAKARDYIGQMGPEFFKQARRPRLSAADLERVDDITAVDNATLQEAFSALGFHKVAVALAMAGEAAREKILRNLSKKIAAVVREEASAMAEPDEDEAADVEKELIERIKTIKGLAS
ncbi:cyclic nucleotide-binding domain-containing protein [Solidesulfovibrio sp. C21]|uniref:cyclic nucleotide-binding domain-containing protein n=1 Tax=Solidesulfovibrio sp. C21 TaxID=3398613 RepID=UPI0039FC78BA